MLIEWKIITAANVSSVIDSQGIIIQRNFWKPDVDAVASGLTVLRYVAEPWGLKLDMSGIGQIMYGLKYILRLRKDGFTVIPVKMSAINLSSMKSVGERSSPT
ncbi:hypothetical protein CIB84_011969 [Bambusicola thoracicus]|uniref:Uncharacterized protein n=1 Tax=Bambusicola thoracicus TaxID=9083 RepID=A0A2P4SJJ1_BAMTH|nr:hypothetical protein CIB84_011969 [Bambusicola thoracicus]